MKARPLLILGAVIVIAALFVDWELSDYYLRAPVGLFVYLLDAFVITWAAFIGARSLWIAKARPLLILGAVIVIAALFVVWKSDYFLREVGLFVYLPYALVITWAAFIGARSLWIANHPHAITLRSGATELGIQVGLLLLSMASIIAVPIAQAVVVYHLYHRDDPIGVGSDVDRAPCETHELAQRENGHGVVASVRQTMCTGNWDPILMYFVFVHRSGEPNTHENLVFRYEDSVGTGTETPPPTVSWANATNLRIEAHGQILQLTKRRVRAGNVSITYRVRPKYALHYGDIR